ncbi:MAG: Rne/Rng family ribonuclease [Desulfocapsa sp.]|nr:Rne/Rng family ribonuclease [Desulfocapsa sp.]
MVDKKTEPKEKAVQKKSVKASTGAWWKSTTQKETAVKETPVKKTGKTAPEKSEEKETPKPKRKAAPKKSAAKPQPPRKKAAPRKKPASKAKESKAKESKAKESKAKESKAKESKAKESKTTESVDVSDDSGKSLAGSQLVAKSEVLQPEVKPEEKPEVQSESESETPVERPPQEKPSRPRGRSNQKEKSPAKGKQQPQDPVEKQDPQEKPQSLKLLINAEEPEECRLALLADGRLESIHVSTVSSKQTKNNIYKAKIVAIESNLQAAFVDYGTDKNGFLPFNEIHPEYYKQEISEENKRYIEQHQWKKLRVTDVLERGQEVLVQVVKEEVGNKGANMTTYLSIPGRGVVLMPGSDSSGISRKISGEERRSQLREIMDSLNIPEGVGWIVRTASIDVTKTALTKDVRFLAKLWREIKKKGQLLDGVGRIYQDHDCVLRFLREHFDPEIKEILVDDLAALEKVKDFLDMLPTKQKGAKARLHKGSRPIFNQFNVEDQIESIYQPQVQLPSGGSIVIDPTEALVAIDVNSGSTGKGKNFEESIFKANMEAATELARQLRLRDLGGLIVVDFIDMRINKNIREVERQVKNAMRRDRAKVDISRISKFGLMQISRQKLGAPIETSNYRVCEHCKGRGIVRSVETLALFYLRRIQTGASRKEVVKVECHFPLDVAQYLLNNKRNEISEMETRNKIDIIIVADPSLKPADHEIICHKAEKDNKDRKQP